MQTPINPFKQALAERRAQIGLWQGLASSYTAEICAGAGFDWLLIDGEHSPNDLMSVLQQAQAIAAYPATHAIARIPLGHGHVGQMLIKQYLDLGVRNLLLPMIDSAEQAEEAIQSTRYPPEGNRGVGSALARASRWNRIPDYLGHAGDFVSVTVQVETARSVTNCRSIAEVDGVDAVFVGPSDLAASMGLLGQQDHPDVRAAVCSVIEEVAAAGKPVGVNAFQKETADMYLSAGAGFILVGADVALLARAGEGLAADYGCSASSSPSSY
jgi:4-hydroxy-2-oxoheptanedioate aldolase